ncbi:MAG: bifunctional nuclease family protein [Planctomycetota bacterium]
MATGLKKVEIKRVFAPTPTGTAVLLGNEDKTFLIFIGLYEATALLREMRHETAARPLTHDLIQSMLLGFDLTIKKVIVSDIVDNAFCATLILEQQQSASDGALVGHRNEVRIDARPSDCLVLAVKNSSDIFVTDDVLEQVQDFSQLLKEGTSLQVEDVDLDELFGRSRSEPSAEAEDDEDYSLGDLDPDDEDER